MERHEFLKSLGLGIAVACAGSCLSACGGKAETGTPNNNPPPNPGPGGGTNNMVSVDIAAKMPNVGDQTTSNGVLFFRLNAASAASSFVATEAFCPHQSGGLSWLNAQNKIQCNLHQAEYTSGGAVTQGPQGSSGNTRALKIYSTALSGTTLTATVA